MPTATLQSATRSTHPHQLKKPKRKTKTEKTPRPPKRNAKGTRRTPNPRLPTSFPSRATSSNSSAPSSPNTPTSATRSPNAARAGCPSSKTSSHSSRLPFNPEYRSTRRSRSVSKHRWKKQQLNRRSKMKQTPDHPARRLRWRNTSDRGGYVSRTCGLCQRRHCRLERCSPRREISSSGRTRSLARWWKGTAMVMSMPLQARLMGSRVGLIRRIAPSCLQRLVDEHVDHYIPELDQTYYDSVGSCVYNPLGGCGHGWMGLTLYFAYHL
ncbi:tRNA-dihydrouridine synthase [Histoplasma capsulatum G186AR]|uniref:tRNA-dihydrouridine synthase n=1 Tax=Ajellomyces capsulatus TaxID=5037 RepID=A0A8H8CSE5_AJECA|nr:tRNA-dihydrouridine synthase [Histoplasma capsulatum]QSS73351.1 tRNA-dihydrouridine synthase [Histoplasma capsulatum G186AR]